MASFDSNSYEFLSSPVRVDRQHWADGTVPFLSICCIAYNQEKFIRQCVEGFLLQETTFPVEILIHDDASTDGTALIIKEYVNKYPDLIKPIYQLENQYSKKIKPNITFNYPRVTGKYVAFCEGDDYWTDPFKLHKQVFFLENNKDYIFCWTRFKVLHDSSNTFYDDANSEYFENNASGIDFSYDKFLKGWQTGTQTIVFRVGDVFKINNFTNPHYRDVFLIADLLNLGKGFCLSDFTAVYRKHKDGIFTGQSPVVRAKSGADIYKSIYKCYFDNIYLKLKYIKFNKIYMYTLLSNNMFNESIDALESEFDFMIHSLELKNKLLCAFKGALYNKKSLSSSYFFGKYYFNAIKGAFFSLYRLCFESIEQVKIRFSYHGNLKKLISDKKSPRIIVSLASSPESINCAVRTIHSLFNQTLPPHIIVLCLDEEKFPRKEKKLPKSLLSFLKDGLRINWCDGVSSYANVIYSISEFPEDIIVSASDQFYYNKNWLSGLFQAYSSDINSIHGYKPFDNSFLKSIFNILCLSYGVLFPPNSLFKDFSSKDIYEVLCPKYFDLWFWAMSVINNFEMKVVGSSDFVFSQKYLYFYEKKQNINEIVSILEVSNIVSFYNNHKFLNNKA